MIKGENIFYCDKDDWKEEIAPGEVKMQCFLEAAQWAKSRSKISDFWNAVTREKLEKKDYDFSKFIFPPSFSPNTFFDQGKTAYDGDVIFSEAKFLGSVTFRKEKFQGKVDFSHATFKARCEFDHSIFEKDLIFEYSVFEDILQFSGEFNNKVIFKKCEYFHQMSFTNVNFYGHFLFQENFSVELSYFNKYSYRQTLALVKLLHVSADYSRKSINENIKRIETLKDGNSQELKVLADLVRNEKHYKKEAKLSFDLVDFNANSIIKRVHLNNTSFIGTNLSEVQFIACGWNDKNRLIIIDENLIQKFGYRLNNLRYKNIELSYRQLRLNFEKQKDWELSGKAYQSEMLHRKKRFLNQCKLIEYFFYNIYQFFGFNQDISKPFKIIVFFTFLLFPVLYFEVADLLFWNGIKMSLANTLPFTNFEISEKYFDSTALWWISTFQSFFSLISLTFLLLSLRNRFR